MNTFNGCRKDPLWFGCASVLEAYRFVQISAGNALYTDVGDDAVGVTVSRSSVAEGSAVQPLRSARGTWLVEVGGSVTLGGSIFPGTDGKGFGLGVSTNSHGLDDDIINMTTDTPPGGPGANDAYVVKAPGLAGWAGKDNQVARWSGAAWLYTDPADGHVIYNADDSKYYMWDDSLGSWVEVNAACIAKETASSIGGCIECYKLS